MVCFGLEPRAAGWQAQTIPLSYGGIQKMFIQQMAMIRQDVQEQARPDQLVQLRAVVGVGCISIVHHLRALITTLEQYFLVNCSCIRHQRRKLRSYLLYKVDHRCQQMLQPFNEKPNLVTLSQISEAFLSYLENIISFSTKTVRVMT